MMLACQAAPLPRKFCKVGACFIFNSLRGHALTMLRSLKVILNFRAHAARLMRGRLRGQASPDQQSNARADRDQRDQHPEGIGE